MREYLHQSGRTMIEMIGVLGIMGVLSVGGIAMYDKAIQKYRINQAIEQITNILANLNTIKMRQGNYKGVSSDKPEILVKLNVIPQELVVKQNNKTKLIHAYNGQISIGTAKSFGNTDSSFAAEKDVIVTYSNISKNACLNLSSKDWGKKRTGVIATKKSGPETFIKSFKKTSNEKCEEKNGVGAFCYNKIMEMAKSVSACDCTSSTCTFSVWVF